MKYRKLKKKPLNLSPKSFKILWRKFEDKFYSGHNRTLYNNCVVEMRDELQVFDNIKALIFGSDERVSQKSCTKIIDQYVLIKKILKSCSIEHGKQQVLYPEIMLSLMKDLKQSSKIYKIIRAYASNKSMNYSDKNDFEDFFNKDDCSYLCKLFTINSAELHQAFKLENNQILTYDEIQDAVLNTMLDNQHIFNPQISNKHARDLSTSIGLGKSAKVSENLFHPSLESTKLA